METTATAVDALVSAPTVVKRYDRVNAAWPATVPELTAQEAVPAARLLRKHAFKLYGRTAKARPVKLTSGRRYTYVRGGVFYVNPGPKHGRGGWDNLVHDISHYVHSIVHPDKSGHDQRHEWLERELREYVVAKGWLDGKLKKPDRAKPGKREVKHAKLHGIMARLARWQSKAKRAATAIRKLERQRRYYERD